MSLNPCLTCGACCASYCVSFPETETDDVPGGIVPVNLTVVRPFGRRAMKGTPGRNPRCEALEGRVGFGVRCRIYENRPSTCRGFGISWESSWGNSQCDRARALFGLQPFSPVAFTG